MDFAGNCGPFIDMINPVCHTLSRCYFSTRSFKFFCSWLVSRAIYYYLGRAQGLFIYQFDQRSSWTLLIIVDTLPLIDMLNMLNPVCHYLVATFRLDFFLKFCSWRVSRAINYFLARTHGLFIYRF